jgi:hypothetical protein
MILGFKLNRNKVFQGDLICVFRQIFRNHLLLCVFGILSG